MTPSADTRSLARLIVLGAAAIIVLVGAYLLLSSGSSYTLNAHFLNASGLVDGGSVDIAGRSVGSISDIAVTANGQASVQLSVTDQSVLPLHAGTRAEIRALGQAGVANHYVALTPGLASAPTLGSGSVLPTTQTASLVNYDAILDSFGPTQRANLRTLIANANRVYAGSGARYFNTMLARLSPAFVQLTGLAEELANDRTDIGDVIQTGATDASALATRSPDLAAAVQNTASSLHAIATERSALADSLTRAPQVLDTARRTLARAATTVTALKPTLAAVPAAGEPLSKFLTRVDHTLPRAVPVMDTIQSLLPNVRSTLLGLGPLSRTATPALTSAAIALDKSRTIVRDLRFYSSDAILGVVYGLAGVAAGNYDEWGHYPRLEFTEPYQTAFAGALEPLSELMLKYPLLPSLFNVRTRLFARCPGGNAPPAADGSSPWIPVTGLCDPSEDQPASVNQP